MKINTVCENGTFQRAYRKKNKFVGHYVIVYAVPTKGDALRLGLTVTKSRGAAVVRNRIKRVLRAAWREAVKDKPISGGFDVIIVARDLAASSSTGDVTPELSLALTRLGVIASGAET